MAKKMSPIEQMANERGIPIAELMEIMLVRYHSTIKMSRVLGVSPNAVAWRLRQHGYIFEDGTWKKTKAVES